MTALELTQMFYDGVVKRLSLNGSSSTDANATLTESQKLEAMAPEKAASSSQGDVKSSEPTIEESSGTQAQTPTGKDDNKDDEGVLGSLDGCMNDGFEYSLWTFGETRILVRSRLHGYLSNDVSLQGQL